MRLGRPVDEEERAHAEDHEPGGRPHELGAVPPLGAQLDRVVEEERERHEDGEGHERRRLHLPFFPPMRPQICRPWRPGEPMPEFELRLDEHATGLGVRPYRRPHVAAGAAAARPARQGEGVARAAGGGAVPGRAAPEVRGGRGVRSLLVLVSKNVQ